MTLLHAAPAILLLPLLGFGVLTFAGRRLGDPGAGWLATTVVGLAFAAAVVCLVGLVGLDPAHRSVVETYYRWIPVGGLQVNIGVLIDPLSLTMALFVSGVSFVIHLYSISYMRADPQFRKFFVYMNLFVFSMLVLVMADNFLFTFVGWEGVGTCSYLLIAFWFDRDSAASAGKKAFIVNRVGDVGFLIAMFLIFSRTGTLDYHGVFAHLPHVSGGWATAVALLLLAGAVGKSAQLPLWVWLPDAMEGPTPVSALIHAATMVTAGVYLMTRVGPILALTPVSLTIIAALGAATAFVAATVACAQDDIKRVLAYSTISQLGYMFIGVGALAYGAATFHMVSHAFFKALLFLAAGSVIHALRNEQDMKRMGGLGRRLPLTAATFGVAWLAISGIPPFDGFWSKDAILEAAYSKSPALWAVGVVTALLTAYYMTRLMVLTFSGQARWSTARPAPDAGHGGSAPHEGDRIMTWPLVALAVACLGGGALDLPFLNMGFLDRWLAPVVRAGGAPAPMGAGLKTGLILSTLAVAVAGIGAGAGLWRRSWQRPRLEPGLLRRNYYADDAYSLTFTRGGGALARTTSAVVEARVVDGAVNGVAALARGAGMVVRRAQSGYVRHYALGIAAGTVAILAFMLFRAG